MNKEEKLDKAIKGYRYKAECWKCGYKFGVSTRNCPRCGEFSDEYLEYLKRKMGYAKVD